MILLANTVHLHGKMSYMLQVWGEHHASIDLSRHVQTGCLAELAQLRCHGGHVMTEADGAEALGIPYEWSISVLMRSYAFIRMDPPLQDLQFSFTLASFSSH